jgi:hypothetical protein
MATEHKQKFFDKIRKNIIDNNEKIRKCFLDNYSQSALEKMIPYLGYYGYASEEEFKISTNKETLNMKNSIIDENDDKMVNEIYLKLEQKKKTLINIFTYQNNHKNYYDINNRINYHNDSDESEKTFEDNFNFTNNKNKYYKLNLTKISDEDMIKNKKILINIINNLFINVLEINLGKHYHSNNLPCKLLKINYEITHFNIVYLPNSVKKIISTTRHNIARKTLYLNNSLTVLNLITGGDITARKFITMNTKLPLSLQKLYLCYCYCMTDELLKKKEKIKAIISFDFDHSSQKYIFYPTLLDAKKYKYNKKYFFYELKN